MNNIPPVQGQSLRTADLVRVTVGTQIYRFATTPVPITITAIDAGSFSAVGSLIGVGDVQRDIKSTGNETTITLVGIDTALLAWVLGQSIKGSIIEMWHIFFNPDGSLITTGGVGGAYKFFTGYVNNFTISEQWMEETRSFVGTITVSGANIQLILQNRTSGRFTNNNSWQSTINSDPTDTAMSRVGFISDLNYYFGKDK